MDGVDAHFERFLCDIFHSLAAIAAAAVSRKDIQFVDKGVVAAEFEAEANRQEDVANGVGATVKKPDATEIGNRQELMKGGPRGRLVERDNFRVLLRQGAHHWNEHFFILQTCLE